ncbi:MAG: hypothetical protein U0835_24005 [Isosphaeraceae bacterium]
MIGLDRPSVTLSGRRVVSGPGRPGGPHRRRYLPGLDALETREVLSTLVVMNTNASGPGSLRQLVQTAANGDVVTFDPGLNGKTIKSNSGSIAVLKNVQILGPGKDLLTLDASYGQMFRVLSGATNVTIAGLTIKGGVDEVEGGAIRDWGGNNSTLVLRDDAFIGNKVFGDNARGGAVAKEKGTLRIEGCVFRENTVESLPGHGDASGAAVFAQGRLVVIDSTFEDGQVRAGTLPSQLFTTRGGTGRGGAIAYSAAKGAVADLEGRPVNPEGRSLAGVFISGSTFRSNLIYAGYGAALPKTPTDGGDAFGGAVSIEANDVDGLTVQVLTSQFRDNEANAGQAGEGLGNDLPANGGNAYGGGVWVNAGTSAGLSLLVDQQSGFFGNIAAGGNGRSMPKMSDPSLFHSRRAGDGHGGGIAIEAAESTLATFSIKNSLFASDAEGGRGGWIGQNSTDVWGGDGGNGYGGGVWIDAGASTDSTFSVVGDTFIACGAWGEFGGSATLELGFGGTGGDGIGGALDFHAGGSPARS